MPKIPRKDYNNPSRKKNEKIIGAKRWRKKDAAAVKKQSESSKKSQKHKSCLDPQIKNYG